MKDTPVGLLCLALLVGCPAAPPADDDDSAPATVESPPWCDDGRAESRLSSRRTDPIGVYPDDHWVLPAPDRRTGLRVHLEPDQTADLLSEFPPEWGFLFDAASRLDGWGLTAGIVFRFRFAIDPASVTADAVRLVAFTEDGPQMFPVDIEIAAFPDTVIVRPRFALPAATEVAAVLVQGVDGAGVTSSDGTCVRPAEHLRELLSPASVLDPGRPADVLSPRYTAALEALDLAPEQVAHMTVFTTQSTPMDSLSVLADVQSRTYSLTDIDCETLGDGRVDCDTRLEVMDYRGPDRIAPPTFDGAPSSSYALPVRITLPGPIADGPWPLAVIGHGLGGSRNNQGGAVAELNAFGLAVVGTDAIEHGDHPTRTGGDIISSVLTFFAISAEDEVTTIDPERLRDNFRQSSWDRIQVVEAIRQGIDLDADGAADLDVSRMGYFGASLGGMMGAETMALTEDFVGGFVAISGGRISQIVTSSDTYAPLLDLMVPEEYADDDLRRALPIVQAVVDGGDPMYWARYVVRDRLVGDPTDPPQLLAHYAYQDEVVPNPANRNHAHALGVPLVGRELFALEEADKVAGPLSGNLPNGGTAGLLQFDLGRRNQDPDNPPEPVDHAGVLRTYESWSSWRPFLEAMLDGETAVITDPYAE